jgi:tRNA threonylcarbamoyl adenosine modification protein YeaZ
MKTVYIERSSGRGRDGDWVERLDLDGVGRIVVGTGPGSFAGIRSAIAFAQGYALGRGCEVLGLPSPCAVAAKVLSAGGAGHGRLAVVGDARCGKIWIALFDGFKLEGDVFQVDRVDIGEALNAQGRGECAIATADEERIGEMLKETFGERYVGGVTPDAEGLRLFAERNPSALRPEPLPIYLNPAVRG